MALGFINTCLDVEFQGKKATLTALVPRDPDSIGIFFPWKEGGFLKLLQVFGIKKGARVKAPWHRGGTMTTLFAALDDDADGTKVKAMNLYGAMYVIRNCIACTETASALKAALTKFCDERRVSVKAAATAAAVAAAADAASLPWAELWARMLVRGWIEHESPLENMFSPRVNFRRHKLSFSREKLVDYVAQYPQVVAPFLELWPALKALGWVQRANGTRGDMLFYPPAPAGAGADGRRRVEEHAADDTAIALGSFSSEAALLGVRVRVGWGREGSTTIALRASSIFGRHPESRRNRSRKRVLVPCDAAACVAVAGEPL